MIQRRAWPISSSVAASPESAYSSPDDHRLRLAQLDAEVRTLSKHRENLHARIDFLRNGGAVDQSGQALLEALLREELDISARRMALHAEIDTLRSSRGTQRLRPAAGA